MKIALFISFVLASSVSILPTYADGDCNCITMSVGATPHHVKSKVVHVLSRQKGSKGNPFEGPYFTSESGLLWRWCPSIWTCSPVFVVKEGQEIWLDRQDYFGSSASHTQEEALTGKGRQVCLLGEVDLANIITLKTFGTYDSRCQVVTSNGSIFVERPEVDRLMGASQDSLSPHLLATWKLNDPVIVSERKHRLTSPNPNAYKPTIFHLINLRTKEITAVDKL